MMCRGLVNLLYLLAAAAAAPRPLLNVSSVDSTILTRTGQGQIFTKDSANLTLVCTGTGEDGGPDLAIGEYYVTKNGTLEDASTFSSEVNVNRQLEFSGEVSVRFCPVVKTCDVTIVTIVNLARTTNSKETVLSVKCKETRVGESDEAIISIFTGQWGEWKCDPDRCTMARKKDCLNPDKEICEERKEGCEGTGVKCSEIPRLEEEDVVLRQKLKDGLVSVTVAWASALPDIQLKVTLYASDGMMIDDVRRVNDVTFTGLQPDTDYSYSIVLVNSVGRQGEEAEFVFTTLPEYLTMLRPELSRASELTVAWEEVEGCEDNTATVYLNSQEQEKVTESSFTLSFDQTKGGTIKVVSRGCGEIRSPDDEINRALEDLYPITQFSCVLITREVETSAEVECRYNTRVDLTLECRQYSTNSSTASLGSQWVTDDTGTFSVTPMATCNMNTEAKVVCSAVSGSGAETTSGPITITNTCTAQPTSRDATTPDKQTIPIKETTPPPDKETTPSPDEKTIPKKETIPDKVMDPKSAGRCVHSSGVVILALLYLLQ